MRIKKFPPTSIGTILLTIIPLPTSEPPLGGSFFTTSASQRIRRFPVLPVINKKQPLEIPPWRASERPGRPGGIPCDSSMRASPMSGASSGTSGRRLLRRKLPSRFKITSRWDSAEPMAIPIYRLWWRGCPELNFIRFSSRRFMALPGSPKTGCSGPWLSSFVVSSPLTASMTGVLPLPRTSMRISRISQPVRIWEKEFSAGRPGPEVERDVPRATNLRPLISIPIRATTE